MMADDPPYLSVGTEVSAKYKGAFCEAKIRNVVKTVKCKVLFKQGLGMVTVLDDAVKGIIRVGSIVEAKHPERKEYVEGTITKIQDSSQYTVVFDDGDITTLRRTALCLKSGRHFAESETLDQLPLTHPEHFGNPVIGGRRGRRRGGESSDEEEVSPKAKVPKEEKEADIGRVVCVEGDKKKQRDNWFPGLVVAPTAQDTVRIHVRDEYLVRSFKDGRYYTVPKKETTEFAREAGAKVDNHSVKAAVEKAVLFLDKDELPPHWDRDSLFGLNEPSNYESDHDSDSDNPDDEPREEKDHFVAQLYKFMDDRGTPINQGPTICSKDVDLYRLFYVVHKLGGYNRVTNHNHWKIVSRKLGYGPSIVNVNLVKHVYKRFLHSFEEFYRKLGCTMVSNPRTYRNNRRAGRSIIREKDRLAVKADKDRSDADESEEASVAGSLGTLQDVQDIKMELDETIPEPITPCKIKIEPKEEPEKKETKKSIEKEKPIPKIKEEKKKVKEEEEKKKLKEEEEKKTLKEEETKKKLKEEETRKKLKEEETKKKIKEEESKKKLKEEEAKKKIKEEENKKKIKEEELKKKLKEEDLKKKIKEEEESDDDAKAKTEPKEKPRVRQTKVKSSEITTPPTVKKDIKKEVEDKEDSKTNPVEKKKRLFTRGLVKEKEKLGLNKPGLSPGLAATRQKRAIKDRVKAFVDRVKNRLTKDTSSVTSESSDKSQNSNKEKVVKDKKEDKETAPTPAVKKKEEPVKEEPKVLSEEKKKVGRKKKEKKEFDDSECQPTYKTVCVGDKLKVYYGPTNESKVTYEAKVLSVKNDGPEVMYLVHYTGWNNRYDEYIKHSRIADNLSWVPGRSGKKAMLSFLKPSRRKNSISKPETSCGKPDGPPNAKTENKGDAPNAISAKADSPNSKTSSSIDSSPQGKSSKSFTVTRSSSRNSIKKEESSAEVETEEESDCTIPKLYLSDELLSDKTPSEKVKEILGISDDSSLVNMPERRKTKRRIGGDDLTKNKKLDSKGKEDSTSRDESSPSPKIDRRKKRSQSESENQEKKRQYTRRRRSSSTTEDKSDSVSVEPESPSSGDDKKRTRKRSSGLESLESNSPQKKRRLLSDKKSEISLGESNSQQSISTDDETNQKTTDQDTEDASKGRDFDLIQIRSELKGLDKAVKNEGDSYKSISSEAKVSDKKAENEKLAEDIYEFKEPEPFEFEARKSDDKGKALQRRPLGRLFDDTKKHQAVLLPNMFYKGKKDPNPEEQKKTFLNTIYNFEEERFEKVNMSPRKPVAEEPSSSPSKPFQLFSELPEEESELQAKDTPNPSSSPFADKEETLESAFTKLDDPSSPAPSTSPKSNSHTDIEFNENSNMDSNEVESTSKSCFSRDDDDDEMEDESINFAIQRAIKQDISDDEDTNHTPTLMKSTIFPSQLDKIPDKPVLVESVNVHEQDDLESCPILEKNEESLDKDDHSSNGMESDEESEPILQEDDKDDKEDSIKDEEDSEDDEEEEAETTVIESNVVLSSGVVADNVVMIAGEELVSTSSIITPIVVPNDNKETTFEFSTDLSEEDQVAKAIFSLSSSPVIHKINESIIEPIAATVQVETNDSDISDTDDLEGVKELSEETVKSEHGFSFKAITVPPPDDSESTLSIPYTENKNNDELIINLEPLKPEKESRVDNEENNRMDYNLDSLLCEETIPGSPGCGEESDEKIASEQLLSLESKIERIEEVMCQPIAEEIVSTEISSQVAPEISPHSSPNDSIPVESARSPPTGSSYHNTAENQFTETKDSDDESKVDKTPTKQETMRRAGSSLKRPKSCKKRNTDNVKRRHYRNRHAGSESDDTSENSSSANMAYNRASISSNADSSSNDGRSLSKYNFLVPLDPSMDQNTRIQLIQNSIQQIRKVYADLKSELAVIDRRRKKLRKRERESLAAARVH